MVEIRVVTPPVAESDIETDLANLTQWLTESGAAERYAGGLLGGEWGYGVDFENGVFSMFPFYWGECECGWLDKDFDEPHDLGCYQTELHAREAAAGIGFDYEAFKRGEEHQRRKDSGLDYDAERVIEDRIYAELTAKYGLPMAGCAVHCTCTHKARQAAWFEREKLGTGSEGHAEDCLVIRPNFLHKPSGLRIDWYKWIGRDMEYQPAQPDPKAWRRVFDECVASVHHVS